MYRIEAAIATEPVLRRPAEALRARIVPLTRHLSILPMTDALFAAITVAGAPGLPSFWKAPAGLAHLLVECSAEGPIAYVEAEYFGGIGTQAAQVWDAGETALGPLHLAEGESFAVDGSPLSQALRRLGVDRGDHADEFDAVELGRHRETAGWLKAVTGAATGLEAGPN